MTDKTINTLDTELTTVGANDLIGVWDVAAAQYKKAKRSNVVGATITGGGTIALGGYTLTVPATGTAALRGADNAFSVAQTMAAGVQIGVASNLLARQAAGVLRQKLEGVSIADNGTVTVADGTGRALVYIYYATVGVSALIAVEGSGSATIIYGSSSYFSTTVDTASRINVYASGTNVTVQNKRGATAFISVYVIN